MQVAYAYENCSAVTQLHEIVSSLLQRTWVLLEQFSQPFSIPEIVLHFSDNLMVVLLGVAASERTRFHHQESSRLMRPSTFLDLLVGGSNSISNSVFCSLSLFATPSIEDIIRSKRVS